MNHRILDVFLFYNEIDLLKARLEYLGPLIDNFIIVEANIDFSGRDKRFILNKDLLETLPFSEKIIYHREFINLRSISWIYKKFKYQRKKTRFLWKIQDAQRNATLKPLLKFNNQDIIIFSDLDEFPSESALTKGIELLKIRSLGAQTPEAYSCDQTFYYYNLNNAVPNEKFYGSIITNLETFRSYSPHKLRSSKNELPHIENGGWHFSYFMDEDKILNKIFAISDVENLGHFKKISTAEIQTKIRLGSDLYDRGTELSKFEQLKIPKKIVEAIKKYLPNCAKD